MTVTVPNALSLGTIADGSLMIASDERNNFTAVQVGVNGLIAMFTNAPTKGDLIVSAGAGVFDKLGVGANGQALVADSTQALGVKWAAAAGTTYRKTTAKAVNTTVAATDLLNGEITLAALAASSVVRATGGGDWLQNSGAGAAPPRFQVKLGATTLLDTGAGGLLAQGASRWTWDFKIEIRNLGATNSQSARFWCVLQGLSGGATVGQTVFTTGEGSTIVLAGGQVIMQGFTTAAIDTTAALALVLNVINGSASASYETKLFDALVEVI